MDEEFSNSRAPPSLLSTVEDIDDELLFLYFFFIFFLSFVDIK